MRTVLLIAAALAMSAPAAAQTVLAAPKFDAAPWWMDQPIIASTGSVQTYIQANRASFSASFQAVDPKLPEATNKAVAKIRSLTSQLSAFGADKVRVETTFSVRPIYDQYRDKDGNLISNQRADKIDSYEVNANISVEVRDVSLVERAYSAVVAAQPSSTQPVYFRLEPENETKTQLYAQAVADAARRAKDSVEATGTRLGAVKLIDPTGRACQTDVLVAGAPRGGGGVLPQTVQIAGVAAAGSPIQRLSREDLLRTGATSLSDALSTLPSINAPAPPPPPMPGGPGLTPAPANLPIQPPLQLLTANACVVYSLG